jgi:signal transduction histidine kinase
VTGAQVTKGARVALALAAVPLGVIAYKVQVDDIASSSPHAAGTVAAAWAFVLAGVIAWLRRPANRLGPLMLAAGFALLLRQFRYSDNPLAFTVFFPISEVSYALVAHVTLAYPTGRVEDRLERAFLKVAYVTTLAFPFLLLLFNGDNHALRYLNGRLRESLILVDADAQVVDWLEKTFVIFAWGVLAVIFIALIVRKLASATPRARRLLAPLLLAAVLAALRAVFESALTFVTPPPVTLLKYLFWWQIGALTALPLALIAGLLRARLARATVGELVIELEGTPPQGLQDALARALGDPTLEVAFWLPERREFVDAFGQPVTLPVDERHRSVTMLEHEGAPLAALVHDPSLREEPQLVQAAGAAARLALQNARLNAEVLSQLAKVKESRSRIVAAADEQRQRIERDLHDGAQQRLVALALDLRTAQRRLGQTDDPELERLLSSAVDELQLAVTELRDLARGIYPAILSEEGLAAALESLAARMPVRVTLDVCEERFPAEIEAAAYFLACEALTNAVRYSDASSVAISGSRTNGLLIVSVVDDGVGGADADAGSGLRGLAERLEAHGGRLTVASAPGRGTTVVGELPCES